MLGLDANPEMLVVARRKPADIEWHEGRAESLPFPDASFDAVVSQFGLMFFDDPVAALREMQRVLQPGGRLAVAVCDALEHSPSYRPRPWSHPPCLSISHRRSAPNALT